MRNDGHTALLQFEFPYEGLKNAWLLRQMSKY